MPVVAASTNAELITFLGPCERSFRGSYASLAQYDAAVALHRRLRLQLYTFNGGHRYLLKAAKELAQHRRRLKAACREIPLAHGTRPLYGTETVWGSGPGAGPVIVSVYRQQWDWRQTPTNMQDMSKHFEGLEAYVNTERFRADPSRRTKYGFTGHTPVFRRDYIEYHRVSRMCELYSRVLKHGGTSYAGDAPDHQAYPQCETWGFWWICVVQNVRAALAAQRQLGNVQEPWGRAWAWVGSSEAHQIDFVTWLMRPVPRFS